MRRKLTAILAKIRAVFCALFRHSNIETNCFGYHYCARCGAQLGDSLAGAYRNSDVVGLECDCDQCRINYDCSTWVDRFLCPKPKWLGWAPGAYKAEKERKAKEARETLRKLCKRYVEQQQGEPGI